VRGFVVGVRVLGRLHQHYVCSGGAIVEAGALLLGCCTAVSDDAQRGRHAEDEDEEACYER
jgi:hypothetical protein